MACVGYTNAGKSTLLNRLSGASVYVADQLFATLDPTIRRITLPGGQSVLMVDTVGFIQKLPHTLVAAFGATLEEITQANLLLHIVDASHPDAIRQAEVVENTLVRDLGIVDTPIVTALNKMDLVDKDSGQAGLDSLGRRYPLSVCISARFGLGMDDLLQAVNKRIDREKVRVVVRIPYAQGALIARFHANAIVESVVHEEDHVRLTGTFASDLLATFQDYIA